MPPPSSQGTPTASTIDRTAGQIDGPALRAPSRSTRCRYSAPRSTQWWATAVGIVAEDGFLPVIALPKAYAFPPQVDRRPDFRVVCSYPSPAQRQTNNMTHGRGTCKRVAAAGDIPCGPISFQLGLFVGRFSACCNRQVENLPHKKLKTPHKNCPGSRTDWPRHSGGLPSTRGDGAKHNGRLLIGLG